MLFLDVLEGKKTDCFPLWMMRQAGRYLPEYQALRKDHGFNTLLATPDLAAKVSLQPIERFDLDAIILFSDILVVLQCFGVTVDFNPGVSITLSKKYEWERSDLDAPKHPKDVLPYVFETIRLLKKQAPHKPLIGFSGMPFTLAAYYLEGKGKLNFNPIKSGYYERYDDLIVLLDAICEQVIAYLCAQCEAGVDALQIFDSWANVLTWEQSELLSVAYAKRIVEGVRARYDVPIIYYSRHSSQIASLLQETGLSGISIEWQADMPRMRHQTKNSVVLQGNIDPDLLTMPWRFVQDPITRYLESIAYLDGIILNLGHGITPQANVDTVTEFIKTVKVFKKH